MQYSELIHLQGNERGSTQIKLTPYLLQQSAKYRDKTNEALQGKEMGFRKVFALDASEHSNAIHTINNRNYLETGLLLPAGIDGIILNTNNSFEAILPVADCAAIAAIHRTKALHALVHGGFKGVAGFSIKNGKDRYDNSILENMILELLKVGNMSHLDDMSFYISPMAGDNFELPRDYTQRVFANLFDRYGFDEKEFFLPHTSDNSKIFLDLKGIISRILKEQGIQDSQIHFDSRATNDAATNIPSHRLYTIAKGITEKGSRIGFLENDWDMMDPAEILAFFETQKIAISEQEKSLILSGRVGLYAEADYRLGWHIIHESEEKPTISIFERIGAGFSLPQGLVAAGSK